MTHVSALKVIVVGSKRVGKTAVIVRFLTKRYIGEYRSNSDWLYKKTVTCDDTTLNIEILDISRWSDEEVLPLEQVRWADAFIVTYSICDRNSFDYALQCIDHIRGAKSPGYVPIGLVATKRDLERGRRVSVDEGHEIASQCGCQFYEVSAAENYVAVSLAFQGLIRETRTLQLQRSLPRQRKLSIVTVSKVFGAVFGKNGAKAEERKRRTSFSL